MLKRIILLLIIAGQATAALAQTTANRQAKSLDSVVVTGQFRPGTLRNSAYRVKVISSELIRARGVTDIGGLLNNELGYRFSNDYALGETDLNIMGMGGNNVKILLDGVPLVDRGGNKQSLSQIDINTIERIELVEGPMSVVYGTDALAGVINIITRKTKDKNQFNAYAKLQEESVGNSYNFLDGNGLHQASLGGDGSFGNWRAGLNLSRNDFGGWKGQAPLRAKDMKPKEQWFGGINVGYSKDNLSASYRLDYLNEDIYTPGKYNSNNNTALDADYITNRYTHQAQIDWRPTADWSWSTSVSFQDYKRRTETYLLDLAGGTKTPSLNEGEWDISTFRTLFGRSLATWRINNRLSWQPGIEYKRDATTGQRIEGNPVISDYAFFNSLEYQPTKKWLIRPGLRISHNSTYKAPPLIPSLNLKYSVNDNLDLRLSYARGFRAPALRELYFNFHDSNHDIVGNPHLEAEYSNSFNGSVSWQMKSSEKMQINAMAGAFYNAFNNRIDMAVGAGNVYTYFNISKYRTAGFTTEHRIHTKRLDASLGFSYIARYNEFHDSASLKETTGKKYAWSPELNSNISYLVPRINITAGFYYKFNGRLPVFAVGTNNNNEQIIYLSEMAAYHWADFTLTKTLFQSLTLQAGVKNIFNVTRIQNTLQGGGAHSSSGPSLMAYGRSGFAGIRYQFSSKHKNQ